LTSKRFGFGLGKLVLKHAFDAGLQHKVPEEASDEVTTFPSKLFSQFGLQAGFIPTALVQSEKCFFIISLTPPGDRSDFYLLMGMFVATKRIVFRSLALAAIRSRMAASGLLDTGPAGAGSNPIWSLFGLLILALPPNVDFGLTALLGIAEPGLILVASPTQIRILADLGCDGSRDGSRDHLGHGPYLAKVPLWMPLPDPLFQLPLVSGVDSLWLCHGSFLSFASAAECTGVAHSGMSAGALIAFVWRTEPRRPGPNSATCEQGNSARQCFR